jgi:hypothetical protein
MATFNVYQSSLPFMQFALKDGTLLVFKGGRYYTVNPDEIAELDAEVKKGNPYISVNPDQLTVEEATLDPLFSLKQQLRDQILAEQASTGVQSSTSVASNLQTSDVQQPAATPAQVAAAKVKV